ncbi:MAG: hypothetical protein JW794_05590 [Candidatus Cloacimonetes bacterium]|nr:hypothetical protein [Candidatus Cloacimonadota bacterium]
MHALVGVIIFLIPTMLLGLNVQGDVYISGSAQQDVDLMTESKGILGGTLKLINDSYYIDAQTQYSVPLDTTQSESNISLLGEIFFPWFSVSTHIYYQDGRTQYRDYLMISGEIFRTIDNPQSIIEYGDVFKYSTFWDYNTFNHIDNTLYLLYKHFFRRSALHTYFDFSYRYFNNYSDPSIALSKASSEIYVTQSIKRNIGLKYGFFINKNITTNDSLIYMNSDLYDTFAYDLYTVYLGGTIYLENLLMKPELSYHHKIYNNLAEEHPYTENGIKLSLYADYPLTDHIFVYSNTSVYFILDDSSNFGSYNVVCGVRYTFIK